MLGNFNKLKKNVGFFYFNYFINKLYISVKGRYTTFSSTTTLYEAIYI